MPYCGSSRRRYPVLAEQESPLVIKVMDTSGESSFFSAFEYQVRVGLISYEQWHLLPSIL